MRSQVIVPTVVWVSRSLAKCIGTPHGIGLLENIGVVKTRTGLTSEVGYPYLEIMVIAKVPVEVVLVAPIWGHCGIHSQVKVVITPGVVLRPIIAHIHILVVVEALSGLIVSNDSSVFSVHVSSSAVQRGKVTVDSSRGLLGSVLSSPFVNFWMGFDENPRGLLQLVLLVQEFALHSSDWCLEGSIFNHLVTRLRFTSRIPVFASVRPGVSKGCVLSYLVFKVGYALLAFTVCLLLSFGGIWRPPINRHHFRNRGRRDMKHCTPSRRSPSRLFLGYWTCPGFVSTLGKGNETKCW
eukprot:Gb_34926 [translate_table: standard]